MLNDDLNIRPLTASDANAFKALRLVAIADSPSAVWSTAEEEASRTPEQVLLRIEHTTTQVVFGTFMGPQLVTGALQIQLCVNTGNERAKNLYLSLGFKTYGVEPRSMRVAGRFYDEEHMCLMLEQP